jgi:hypothetical protein
MSFNFDSTAATQILKVRYTEKKIETLTYQSALLALMPKDDGGGGASYNGSIRSAVTTARSANDNLAFTTGNASVYNMWTIPWKSCYASANITGEAIDKAKGDQNALVDALVGEFDGAFVALGIDLGGVLFGNGGGAIGQISATSNPATPTITLTDPSRIINFQIGQILQTSIDDGTGGAGVKAGTVTIAKFDEIAGTITATGNWTAGIATAAVNDFVFNNGDYNAKVVGLAGWLPPAASRPSAGDNFFGVNRSTAPVKLAGVYYSGGGAPKEESLIQASMLVARTGGKPDYCVCNPLDYADLAKALESRARIVTPEAYENPQISFSGIQVATPYGVMTIISDVFCPVGTAYLLQMSTWLLISLGKLPKVIEQTDGLSWLRNAGADSYQMRTAYRAALYCAAPGYNAVITW